MLIPAEGREICGSEWMFLVFAYCFKLTADADR